MKTFEFIIAVVSLGLSVTALVLVIRRFGERPERDDSQDNGGVAKP